MGVVLDSSALLALMLREVGWDVVEAHLEGAVISAVNLAEVGARMLERGSTLGLVQQELEAAQITAVAFDDAQALRTAQLRPMTKDRGLSLGDRACLALAAQIGRTALTADREWIDLDLGIDIRLIR